MRELMSRYKKLKADSEMKEKAAKRAKEALDHLTNKVLPEAMDDEGITDFTTEDGLKVVLKRTIRANIPADRREEGFKWLADHGLEHLIKNTFTVVPPDKADEQPILDLFKKLPCKWDKQAKVNPNSLSAAVRELMTDGTMVDHELLGVFNQRKAIIKETKIGI